MGRLHVFVPALFPEGWAPTERFRLEQWIPYLKQHNIYVEIRRALPHFSYYLRYRKDPVFTVAGTLHLLEQRLADWFRILGISSTRPDVIWILREISFLPWSFLEKAFANTVSLPIVYDFDDALWLPLPGSLYPARGRQEKFRILLERAKVVIAGNRYLEAEARRYRPDASIFRIPTVIDTRKYFPAEGESSLRKSPLILGWIGSEPTFRHNFLPFWNIFLRILRTFHPHIRLWIMAPALPEIASLQRVAPDSVRWFPYTPYQELRFLQQIDVGLMPLPDNPWNRGKCGFKLIQYMACGKPVLASPTGMNREVVQPGIQGFLVDDSAESWLESVEQLLRYPELRQEMGREARSRIEQEYSIQRWLPVFITALQEGVRQK